MTTRELITLLETLDPTGEAIVLERRYSDYGPMEPTTWSRCTMYRQDGGAWYTPRDFRFGSIFSGTPVEVVHYEGN